MNFKPLFFLLFLLPTHLSQAAGIADLNWQEIGNGGDALLCDENSTNPQIELLDFFEARESFGLSIDLGAPDLSPIEKARFAFQRFKKFDATRADLYLHYLDSFCSELVIYKPERALTDVQDSGYLELPQNCRIEQIVLQKTPETRLEKRYRFNSKHWPLTADCTQIKPQTQLVQLDNDQMAGFIIHEIVYRDALSRGHANSRATRWLTAIIASDIETILTIEDLQHDMFKNGFHSYAHLGKFSLHFFEKYSSFEQAQKLCRDFKNNSYLMFQSGIFLPPMQSLFNSAFATAFRNQEKIAVWGMHNGVKKRLIIDFNSVNMYWETFEDSQHLPVMCLEVQRDQ